jgi:hypothetical protein
MIVADTNLIAYFSIHTEHSALAEAVCAVDSIWAAPLLWRLEYRATLLKYIRHAGMNFEAAMSSLRLAEETVAGREYANARPTTANMWRWRRNWMCLWSRRTSSL